MLEHPGPEKQEIGYEIGLGEGVSPGWLPICSAPASWGRPTQTIGHLHDELSFVEAPIEEMVQ